MSQDEVIAKRYARALAELAQERDEVEVVGRDVKQISDLLDKRTAGGAPELMDFLVSPVIPPEVKNTSMRKILGQAGIGKTTVDFIAVLIQKGRVELVPRIARLYNEMAGDMTGVLPAEVHTARPLSEDQTQRLTAALVSAFGKEVRLHVVLEPGLLAGAKITVAGKTLDGSVLGKLERMRHTLMAANTPSATVGVEA